MNKTIFTITAFLIGIVCIGQTDTSQIHQRLDAIETQLHQLQSKNSSLAGEVEALQNVDVRLRSNISNLSSRSRTNSSKIENHDSLLQSSSIAIGELDSNLSQQNSVLTGQISQNKKIVSSEISNLERNLSRNTLYWIIAVLFVAFLSLLAFILLRKKLSSNQSSLLQTLGNAQNEFRTVTEFQKSINIVTEALEKQMKLITQATEAKPTNIAGQEQDHSLVLKVADRLVGMEKNLSQMDDKTRGLKQLKKGVQNIRDNFKANGYEIVEMVGKPFDDGMKLTANFRPDESLKPGERIITRIIKPQINYKGEMIQSAQVEVSQGE